MRKTISASSSRRRIRYAAMAAGFLLYGFWALNSGNARTSILDVQASSSALDWNAVAISADRVIVAGPRWTGFHGPSVAILTKQGALQAFPTVEWNGWKPGLDATKHFVNVNALHIDPEGTLWVVDTGTPQFGGPTLVNGPKLVRLDPQTGNVLRIYPLGPDVAPRGSYIDDIRFNGPHAYLTDAGKGAILVLDIATGVCRRVLDGVPATQARPERPIVMEGDVVKTSNGAPLLVNADPLEVSPDGRFLYFGPLEGPWSKVPTALLDNPATPAATLAASVEPWADLPPIGGSAMDARGALYFTALKDKTVYRRDPDGRITPLVSDDRLNWADAPFLTHDGQLWLPVAQLNRLPQFQQGRSRVALPFLLLSMKVRPGRYGQAAPTTERGIRSGG
ncbi:L-dopachrome tautomerase-related protein [Acetobacter sacchari]